MGVRYLTSGVKVYYLPLWLVYDQVSLPTLYGGFPLYRSIFLRESIDLVHGHQVGSGGVGPSPCAWNAIPKLRPILINPPTPVQGHMHIHLLLA